MGSLHLYLPDSEITDIKTAAEQEGISVSEYVRKQLHYANSKIAEISTIIEDVQFLRRGLEAHWKEKTPKIYEAARNRTQSSAN